MLEVCVDDCALMAAAGQDAVNALKASPDYFNADLKKEVEYAIRQMDNYRLFPLEELEDAHDDWCNDKG